MEKAGAEDDGKGWKRDSRVKHENDEVCQIKIISIS